MKASELVEKMMQAGATLEACVIALKAIEARDDAISERRQKDAERKRRQRAKTDDVTGQSRDSHGDKSVKENTPHTPQKKYPLYPPKGGSFPQTEVHTGDRTLKAEVSPLFERFWQAYPANPNRGGKKPALSQFFRLVKGGMDPEHLISAARAYAKTLRDTEFCHAAHRWLAEEHWENVDVPTNTPTDWRAHIALHRNHGKWLANGPPPDHPDCQAPAEALAEFGYRQAATC